jgi:hypothetical protein
VSVRCDLDNPGVYRECSASRNLPSRQKSLAPWRGQSDRLDYDGVSRVVEKCALSCISTFSSMACRRQDPFK